MKHAAKFIASLAALYLFGGVATWTSQDKQLAPAAQDKQTINTAHSGTISLGSRIGMQKQDPARAESRASRAGSQSGSAGIQEPPFLKHRLLFAPNSRELTAQSRNALRRAAAWLRVHREARILIVGYCDSLGSDTCTHTLAQGRGDVVRQFLVRCGTESGQIVGVKGWDNVYQPCLTITPKWQQLNRSAQLFMASSRAP